MTRCVACRSVGFRIGAPALRDELVPDDPFITKYARFVGNALQSDLGTSYFFKRPAVEVILDKLVATLNSCLVRRSSLLFSLYHLGCIPRSTRKVFEIRHGDDSVGISIPVFLTAIMLMYVFSADSVGYLPTDRARPLMCSVGNLTVPLMVSSTLSCRVLR